MKGRERREDGGQRGRKRERGTIKRKRRTILHFDSIILMHYL